MEIISVSIIGALFVLLIIAVILVIYRFVIMTRELRHISYLIKKQVKAESSRYAKILEHFDEEGSNEVSEIFGRAGKRGNDESRRTTELFGKVMERLDDIDRVLADYLSEQPEKTVHTERPETAITEEIPVTRQEAELTSRVIPEAEEEPTSTNQAFTPVGWPTESAETAFDDDAPEEKKRAGVIPEKTVVTCPNCSRQLAFEALKLQDEQICPYCQETFRSNSYLLSLITDGKHTKRGLG